MACHNLGTVPDGICKWITCNIFNYYCILQLCNSSIYGKFSIKWISVDCIASLPENLAYFGSVFTILVNTANFKPNNISMDCTYSQFTHICGSFLLVKGCVRYQKGSHIYKNELFYPKWTYLKYSVVRTCICVIHMDLFYSFVK